MKVRAEVSAEKLRGGFYSPLSLVRVCLDRVAELTENRDDLALLEPSAGDGAFLKGLASHPLRDHIGTVTAVEILDAEAAKTRDVIAAEGLRGDVVNDSFLTWAPARLDTQDAAVGNPPFVRFQFVSEQDQQALPTLAEALSISLAGVSNLWIPVLLGALGCLRMGGVFAFIIPSECFTGISARTVRTWLGSNVEQLTVDLFPPGSFPSVLQEVVVLSGRRREARDPSEGTLRVREHFADGRTLAWEHRLAEHPTWTRHLLEPAQVDALEQAIRLSVVQRLGIVARFEVAAVTGANDFFCVDEATVESYDLRAWVRPLIPRIRHAAGLIYRPHDHSATIDSGSKSFLLDFSPERPEPREYVGPSVYLDLGTAANIHSRYKTRIRQPWYRVPLIRAGRLLLSKRSHRFPRVVINDAAVVSTDTIYRGELTPDFVGRERDLVAAFHNSLTLLTAEVEGRSFGGGVLELVPTEIARLSVPMSEGFGAHLMALDAHARSLALSDDGEDLVELTDGLLLRADVGLTRDLLSILHEARLALVRRRFDRN